MKCFQKIFLDLIDGNATLRHSAFDYLSKVSINDKKLELTELFQLIIKISNNHHHTSNFYDKIETIIKFLKEHIKQSFSNKEILNISQSNKRIILYLIKDQILKVDGKVVDSLIELHLQNYFIPEISSFYNGNQLKLSESNRKEYELFELKRKSGENDENICQLIRNDSIDEFISYVNRLNLPLSQTTIKKSIFETNSFLFDKQTTLVEYAAFFGSIQIFKFLQLNEVELTSSLWLYAIHSNNAELIHILEENHVMPDDETYKECFNEATKCHHNNIANYIKENLLTEKSELDVSNEAISYFNCEFLPNDFKHHFYSLIKHNYVFLLDTLIKKMKYKITLTDDIFFFLMFL